MSTTLRLVQGTPEWLEHRRKYRNASETPAVMGVSPWQTPYGLWLEKTGRQQRPVTPAMRRGRELEVAARAAYETLTGLVTEPLVLVEGEYSASLDGITLEGDLILEIKAPMRKRPAEIAMGGGEVRVEVECMQKFFHRFVGAPHEEGEEAKCELCPRIAVVKFRRAGGERRRLLHLRLHDVATDIARHQQHERQHAVHRRIVGVALHGPSENADRRFAFHRGEAPEQ